MRLLGFGCLLLVLVVVVVVLMVVMFWPLLLSFSRFKLGRHPPPPILTNASLEPPT